MEVGGALALDGLHDQAEQIAAEGEKGQGRDADLEQGLQLGGLRFHPGGRMRLWMRVPGTTGAGGIVLTPAMVYL